MGSEAPMFHFQRALCKPFSKLSFESLLMRAAFIMATLSTLSKCCGIAGFSTCLPALKGLLWPASADCSHLTYSIRAWSSHCQDSWGAGAEREKCLVGPLRLLAEWQATSLLWKWVRVGFQAVFSSLALQALSVSPTLLFQSVPISNNTFWHPSSSGGWMCPPGNNTSPSRPSGALQDLPHGRDGRGRAGCRFSAFPPTERWVYVPLPFNPGFKSISGLLFNVVNTHTHTQNTIYHLSHCGVCSSVVFSKFTLLWNRSPGLWIMQAWNFIPITQIPSPSVTYPHPSIIAILFSLSMNSMSLDSSCRGNYTVFVFLQLVHFT